MKSGLKGILKYVLTVLAAFVLGAGFYYHIGGALLQKNTISKIGFEDIGELATQSAYCTAVSSVSDTRKLLGQNIPLTESKFIFSYDVVIKAGYDFADVDWSIEGKTITVRLPQAKILSSELINDSLEVLYSKESIFNDFTIEENNSAVKELKQKAEASAIENGLYENARTNAEVILTAFIGKTYNLAEYSIVFE